MVLVNPLLLVFYNNSKQKLNHWDREKPWARNIYFFIIIIIFSTRCVQCNWVIQVSHFSSFTQCMISFSSTASESLCRLFTITLLFSTYISKWTRHPSNVITLFMQVCKHITVKMQYSMSLVSEWISIQNCTLECSTVSKRITLQMYYSVSTSKCIVTIQMH